VNDANEANEKNEILKNVLSKVVNNELKNSKNDVLLL